MHFTATNATLIGEPGRCFQIPRARERPQSPFGGIGQRNIWYGLNDKRAAGFCKSLNDYMQSMASMQTPEKPVVESRKRRLSERLERWGTHRQFIRIKGYRCEACEWSIEENEQDVWGSSFELHPLTPFSELEFAGLGAPRLGRNPGQQQAGEIPEGQSGLTHGRHDQGVGAVDAPVLKLTARVGAGQGTQHHQPCHEPRVGSCFTGSNQKVHLIETGEVVQRLGQGYCQVNRFGV